MIRQPPRSTQSRSSAASDVYKRQTLHSGNSNIFRPIRKNVIQKMETNAQSEPSSSELEKLQKFKEMISEKTVPKIVGSIKQSFNLLFVCFLLFGACLLYTSPSPRDS
eukprot:TRINITY_DN16920_c0_g1_i1.p1 TRINITY_DN16920_c0_g1~~TRINITY_DN16920_c0_g1_i1.p1  ORF type:complete len:108 (+),score=22.30 TRINITY_DN16920_c0_g1_i1:2-325(+)